MYYIPRTLLVVALLLPVNSNRILNFDPNEKDEDLIESSINRIDQIDCQSRIKGNYFILYGNDGNLHIPLKNNVEISQDRRIIKILSNFLEPTDPLACLNLSHNSIDPEELLNIGRLKNLKTLYLNHQNISWKPLKYPQTKRVLGPSTVRLSTLVHLNVKSSNVESLPNNFTEMFPNLRYLDVSDNPLINVPSFMKYIPVHLESLLMRTIGSEQLWLDDLKNIQTIHLDGNVYQKLGRYYFPSYLAFERINRLTSISLRHCRVEVIDFQTFDLSPNLTLLDISYNSIVELNPRVYALKSLKHLILNHNRLEKFIPTNQVPLLTTLSLSCNEISTIPNNLYFFPLLKTLSLRNNRITTVQDDAFRGLTFLQQLDLAGNQLKYLPHNWDGNLINLRYLNVNSNGLSNIDYIIAPNTPLMYLFIRNNSLRNIDEQTLSYLPKRITVYLG